MTTRHKVLGIGIGLVVLLVGWLLAGAGCNPDVAGAVVTATGDYLGAVVSVVVSDYLQDALDRGVLADGNEHAAPPLHDYEH